MRNVLLWILFSEQSFNSEMINENKSHTDEAKYPFISFFFTGERTLKSPTLAASESRRLYCCRRQQQQFGWSNICQIR